MEVEKGDIKMTKKITNISVELIASGVSKLNSDTLDAKFLITYFSVHY